MTYTLARVVGSDANKAKLAAAFDKKYYDFMYTYDPDTSVGQSWYDIVSDLSLRGKHYLNEWESTTFEEALEDYGAMIGDEFDLDLEYSAVPETDQ